MKRFSNIFFSMTSMGVLLLIFAFSIGAATFIENDFGTQAARALVYNATWFDILLGLLAANMIVNIFKYKMYQKKKFTLFIFHIAFLIILIGSAITRFISYEGMLHLRNGQTSDVVLSDQTYIHVKAQTGNTIVSHYKHVLLSELSPRAYEDHVSIDGQNIKLKAVKFIPHAQQTVTENDNGVPIVMFVASDGSGRQNLFLKKGGVQTIGNYIVKFGGAFDPSALNIKAKGDSLFITTPDTMSVMHMSGGASEKFLPKSTHPFVTGKLFTMGTLNLVMTGYYPSGAVKFMPGGKKSEAMNVVLIKVQSGNESKEVYLSGGSGFEGEPQEININGIKVSLSYGARIIHLPFSVRLDKFELKRYPGSMSPSSYASRITVIDPARNKSFPYHIYMNHVLDYNGYRFFQSSYDRDEQGSILSVNHDFWGTIFTYIGYILLALGMFLSLINSKSYFAQLGRYLKKFDEKSKGTTSILLIFLLLGVATSASAQQSNHIPFSQIPVVNKQQADKFGRLVVQSNDGRIKPVYTLASQILRKLTWKTSFHGLTPDQVFLGMMSSPHLWERVPMIKIDDKKLAEIVGIKGKYASFLDFIDPQTKTYKLKDLVEKAYETKPIHRGMFDKEVMKVDERLNISYMVYTGEFLKIIPDPHDPDKAWYSPASKVTNLTGKDSLFVVSIIPEYLTSLNNGNLKLANELEEALQIYQKKFGASIMPSQRKLNAELLYTKLMIFLRLAIYYSILGFILLILVFADILRSSSILKKIMKGVLFLIIIGFAFQTFGLILRWYISGHAPWTDGYESMIYIAWVTMLAGLIFSKRSLLTAAATTILASIILFVAHLSWMDPEITNLVPVLKSYWLMIHVSVITASYGFLALGMMLGFLNLILMIFKTPKNYQRLSEKVAQITAINERTLIVGLYMLTLGMFLGGVWANESWGRYWGWDPKETWALVSVLIYSFVSHMRLMPGMKSRFTYNAASVLAFFSILMTYFGVNYYLSGLHSYAKGDPIPIPTFVYYTVATIFIVIVAAYFNEKRISKKTEGIKEP
ncbi:MAG: cytochrome c biogenesis protein CcsA [Bacteroidales bacterium]|nr:cytochrome c biogenesis protein CcsA [Bacteroidales bacterium]